MLKNKTLIVGWDAADWQVITPLLKKGAMPALKRMIETGVKGNLATLDPPLSPILWTSIATGKRAYDHGILGFTEVDENQNLRAVRGSSRTAKAFWNILNQNQISTNIVGWWPSHPAEPVLGAMVSNFYGMSPKQDNKEQSLKKGSVYPESIHQVLADLIVRPEEITAAMLQPFFPKAQELLSDHDEVLRSVIKILSQTASVHNAATFLLEENPADCTAVYYDAIDHFSHLAMKYHPPQLKNISDKDYNNYHFIVEAAYRFSDMMLERLLELSGPNTTTILISDHGFTSGPTRYTQLPQTPAAPALEHRYFGVFVANGPNIKNNQTLYGASLLDITPTLLHHYNLATANDMEGHVLQQIFKKQVPVKSISSYQNGSAPKPHYWSDLGEAGLQQLAELGYIEKDWLKHENSHKKASAENTFYLARSFADGGYIEKAILKMEQLTQEFSTDIRYLDFLCALYLQASHLKEFEQLLADLTQLTSAQAPNVLFYKAQLYLAKAQYTLAHKTFALIPHINPNLLYLMGNTYLYQGIVAEAQQYYKSALAIDPEHHLSLVALGKTQWLQQDFETALDTLLQSLNQVYFHFETHLNLGKCLLNLNLFSEAQSAFEVALTIEPHNKEAMALFKLSCQKSGNPVPSSIANATEQAPPMVVVTGLPRSGTSLLMQMLNAGGLNIIKDEQRVKDENNPKGYFENKAMLNPSIYTDLFSQNKGSGIKITFPLVTQIPASCTYKIISVHRNLNEVLLSQSKMLNQKNNQVSFSLAQELAHISEFSLQWIKNQAHLELLELNHAEIISNPDKIAQQIARFINRNLDVKNMAKQVDINLYRSKAL